MRVEIPLRIAADHPAFAGHFPGAPIVPGVVLLDAAVHAAMHMAGAATGTQQGGAHASCQITAAKFVGPVGPGEALTIVLTATPSGSTHFEISSDTRKVATGTLVLSAVT